MPSKKAESSKIVHKPKRTKLAAAKKTVTPKAKAKVKPAIVRVPKQVAKPKISKKIVPVKKSLTKKSLPAPTVTLTKVAEPVLIADKRFSLVALAPLKPMQIAMFTRVAGLFFVMLGAFFSLYHMPYVFDANVQMAQVSSSVTTTTSQTTPTNSLGVSGEFVVPTGELHGDVRLEYTHNEAQSVKFLAYQVSTDEFITLGTAERTTNTRWRKTINTEHLDDGQYKFIAIVTVAGNAWQDPLQITRTIKNTIHIIPDVSLTVKQNGQLVSSPVTATLDDQVSLVWTIEPASAECTLARDGDGFKTINGTNSFAISLTDIDSSVFSVLCVHETDEIEKQVVISVTDALTEDLEEITTNTNDVVTETQSVNEADNTADSTKETDADNDEIDEVTAVTVDIDEIDVVVPTEVSEEVDESEQPTESTPLLKTPETIQTPTPTPAEIKPSVVLELPERDFLTDTIEISIAVDGAQFIELYVQSERSGEARFVGLAKKRSDGTWRARLETVNIPNGRYALYAKVKNIYGLYQSSSVNIAIQNKNETTPTPAQVETFGLIQTVGSDLKELVTDPPVIDTLVANQLKTSARDQVSDDSETNIINDETIAATEQNLEEQFQALRLAIRNNDQNAIQAIKQSVRTIQNDIISQTASADDEQTAIADSIEKRIVEREKDIERKELIIRDRVGDAALLDSDQDGVTDYDEINLYQTNPLAADSDLDGVIDSAEIERGFNPNDASPEALVRFESPKEVGEVRKDILEITTLATIVDSDNTGAGTSDGVAAQAMISGRGLPNSFVTVYIFSTPVVVTVKTDSTGAWSYTFEKELEDGTHEVYVGITDNAGRIVAKSEPLAFVKQAQAFSPVNAASVETPTITTATPERSLSSTSSMLLIASISVVAIGLVLILLGLYIDRRERSEITPVTA